MFHVPHKHRIKHPILGGSEKDENNGFFIFPVGQRDVRCQASDGRLWEHVSVSTDKMQTPSWEIMCYVKNLFWDEEDTVIQYHPPKSKYVNMHKSVLHLWRSTEFEIIVPETLLIGLQLND